MRPILNGCLTAMTDNGTAETINSQREDLISQGLALLHAAIDDLGDNNPSCRLRCDSFLLNALVKSLEDHGLAWPNPPKPFSGVSIAVLIEAVSTVQKQSQQWHAVAGGFFGNATPTGKPGAGTNACGAKIFITPQLEALASEVKGLDLESSLGYYLY
jgi:hypothetical protein